MILTLILYAPSASLLAYIVYGELTFWRPWRREIRDREAMDG